MTKSTESQRRTGKVTFCLFVVLFIHPWLLHRLLHDLAIPTWSCESSCLARYRQRSASETVPVGYDTMRRTEQRTQWNQDVTWLSVSLSLSLSVWTSGLLTEVWIQPLNWDIAPWKLPEKSVDFFENTISKLIIQPNVCWQWLCWTFFYTCRHRNFEFLIYG